MPEYKNKRSEFIKGFKKLDSGPDEEQVPDEKELSPEEQAQAAEDESPLKSKITRGIINLLKKKGPPPASSER